MSSNLTASPTSSNFDVVTSVIRERRTAHKWKAEPVDDAVVDAALAAANMAPCHKFTWPWRFSVAGPQTREKIVALGLKLKSAGKDLDDDAKAAIEAKLRNAGALLIVRQVRSPTDAHREKEDYAAVACALQNVMLTVSAAGYASKWSTGKLACHPDVYSFANVDESKEQLVGFLWIGVPAQLPKIERPAVDSVVERLP